MQTTVVPFALHSYQSRSLPWAAQRCVNWRPQSAPPVDMTKSAVALMPRYAKERFGAIDGACRGNHTMNGVLYTVCGTRLYSVDSTGTETELGVITGTQPVTFANNDSGAILRISADGIGYAWNGTTLSIVTSSSQSVAFINSYFVDQVSNISGEFVWSEPGTATIGALNFATAEADGDPLRRVIEHQQELWLFGEKSAEIWGTTGNADSAFQRLSASIERGLLAKHSLCKVDNSMFWIADDRTIRRNAGYQPVRISTDWVDKVLADSANIERARGFYHVEDGHTLYTVTCIEDGWTFQFDVTTGLWTENATFPNSWWNAFFATHAHGSWIVGDTEGGLFKLKPGIYEDDDDTIEFKAVSAPFFRLGARVDMPRLQIDVEAGVGLTTGQGSDPQLMLRWSDDGGHTWSSEKWRTLGALGRRKQKVVFRQLGQFESRIFEVVVTDPVKAVILGVYADINVLPP